MPRLTKSAKKLLCSGCRNNRYNMGKGYQEGPNDAPVPGDECWSLSDAKVIMARRVSTSMLPSGYGCIAPQQTLSCYHCSGYCMIEVKKGEK